MQTHDHKHINKNPLADSAGVPWQDRSFDENVFANDTGEARPELIEAIKDFQLHGDPTQVFVEFAKSRLLIPLLANLGESGEGAHGQIVDKSADLSIVNVKTPDDQVALPVFSSVETMQQWNPAARPVPNDAVRVALAAASEGNTRIVLDPGAETEFAFRRAAIAALAQQKNWQPPFLNEQVIAAFEQSIVGEESIEGIELTSADPNCRLEGPELKIQLRIRSGLSKQQLEEILQRLTGDWANDETIAASVDSMSLVVKPIS